MSLETAQIPIVLSGREWAALCVRFILDKNTPESAATADVAKLKILQEVYTAAKVLGYRPPPRPPPKPPAPPGQRLAQKLAMAALVVVLLIVGAHLAAAQPPMRGGLVTHNGSLMTVEVLPDGLVRIRYVDPRPAMRAFVVPGTLLVEGRWWNGAFIGISHSYWCGLAYPYTVRGSVDPGGALILNGLAPIIDPYSCGVLGYEWTGNSTLVFAPYDQPPPNGN